MPSFIDDLLSQGPSETKPAPSSPNFIDELFAKSAPPSVMEPAKAEPATSEWGLGSSLAQGALLGGYAPAQAYLKSVESGKPYAHERAKIERSREAFANEHPLASGFGELAGSLPPTLAALSLGQDYAVAPMLGRLGAAFPKAASWFAGEGLAPMAARGVGKLGEFGAQGAASGVMQSGLTGQGVGEAAGEGALYGVPGGIAGRALMKPFASSISPEMAGLARKFIGEGNKLFPGQVPGGPLASKLLGTAPTEGQTRDFTKALARTLGEDANKLTPEFFHGGPSSAGAFDRIGAQMENAARGAKIPMNDPHMDAAISRTMTRAANEFGTDSKEYGRLYVLYRGLQDAGESGTLSGKAYLDLTQKGSALKNNMARTSPTRQYAIELKSAIDDALERHNPAQAKEIAQARHRWHNAVIAEDNVDPTTGLANPKALLRAVESNRHYGSASMASKKANAAGESGDIGTVALGGKNFLSASPNSPGSFVSHHPGWAGLGAGALLGSEHFLAPIGEHLYHSHPWATALAGALGAGYAGGGAAIARSPAYTNLLLRRIDPFRMNVGVPSATYGHGMGVY